MLEREFAKQGEIKPILDGDTVDDASSKTYTNTSSTDWKSHQQAVNHESHNLYSVTENSNEKPLTGDGYSATNGQVNKWYSSTMTDFFSKEDGAEESTSKNWFEALFKKTRLSVVKHEAPGLVMAPGSSPSREQLVVDDPQGSVVKQYVGTIESPNIYKEVSDKYLFTDEGPNQNDVKQVGVGDCYFWAAVLQILAHDPGKFTSMMKLSGQTVTVTMYHKDGDKWVASTLSRPLGIGGLNCQYAETQTEIEGYGGECGVRVDVNTPCESAWKSTIDGTDCVIDRTDFYKAALWANCLEQIYSDFTRTYGQYGAGFTKVEADGSKTAGSEEFEGGCSNQCFNMFYGSQATDKGVKTNDTANQDRILQALVDFKNASNGGGYTALVARKKSGDPNNDGAHAYSIDNVSLVDKNGQPVVLTGTVDLTKIDLKKSKILMRNPWNSPDSTDGKYFEVTVQTFITDPLWTHLRVATVSGLGK